MFKTFCLQDDSCKTINVFHSLAKWKYNLILVESTRIRSWFLPVNLFTSLLARPGKSSIVLPCEMLSSICYSITSVWDVIACTRPRKLDFSESWESSSMTPLKPLNLFKPIGHLESTYFFVKRLMISIMYHILKTQTISTLQGYDVRETNPSRYNYDPIDVGQKATHTCPSSNLLDLIPN